MTNVEYPSVYAPPAPQPHTTFLTRHKLVSSSTLFFHGQRAVFGAIYMKSQCHLRVSWNELFTSAEHATYHIITAHIERISGLKQFQSTCMCGKKAGLLPLLPRAFVLLPNLHAFNPGNQRILDADPSTWWNDDDAEQYPNEHCNNAAPAPAPAPAPVQHKPIINTLTMRLRSRYGSKSK